MSRRGRIASPSARRVEFTGEMAVPDEFGRLRVILVRGQAGGSASALWAALPAVGRRPVGFATADADVSGVVTLVAPEHRRAYWLEEAARLRGRTVRVEATQRPYHFGGKTGTALDISLIEEVKPKTVGESK